MSIDTIDLIIETLRKHEKKLDALIFRLNEELDRVTSLGDALEERFFGEDNR